MISARKLIKPDWIAGSSFEKKFHQDWVEWQEFLEIREIFLNEICLHRWRKQ
jgi:hypothetical protein